MTHLIRQMGHVTFGTPDPEGSARDLSEIVGLKVTGRTNDAVYLSGNQRRYEIAFRRSERREVLAIGLEAMDAAAVDETLRCVRSEGLEIIGDTPLGPGIARAVRFKAPFGAILEIHTPVARDQRLRHIGPGSRPRRIEHVNLKAPDTLVMRDFLVKVLGMQLSDRTAGDEFIWLRCWDGYHHTVAAFKGEPSLHHYAFDLNALEDLAGIADTLVEKDRALLWGPGRHGAGGNVFTYYIDPNNCVVENSIGMDRIDNDLSYQARTWEITETLADRWINEWGSPPPAGFVDPGLPFAVDHADAAPVKDVA